MKKSLKEYIDGLDLTPEEKTVAQTVLGNQKVVSAIDRELAGAQSEISRSFDAAKVEREKAEKAYADNLKWKTDVDKQLADARKSVEDGKILTTRAQERLRGLVADGVVDEEAVKDILEGSAANAGPGNGNGNRTEPRTEPVVPKGMVSEDEFLKFTDAFMNFVPQMNAIGYRYQTLFGKPPDPEVIKNLPRIAREQNKTLTQVAEEAFKFTDKETELAAAAKTADEARIRADERTKVLSEVKNPTNGAKPPGGWASPVLPLSTPDKVTVDSAAHSARGVMAAVNSFREHKYAQPGQ